MKRFINLVILIFGLSFVIVVVSGMINFNCLFKSLFGISCPGCGLTRSFRAIIGLDFYAAFNYNILGIPLFLIGIITFISLIIDIIKNDNKTIMLINNFFSKHYIMIIILIIMTAVINNIKGI